MNTLDKDQKFWLCFWLIAFATVVSLTAILSMYSLSRAQIRADLMKAGKTASEIECMDASSGSQQAVACSMIFMAQEGRK